jgi:translocator protein
MTPSNAPSAASDRPVPPPPIEARMLAYVAIIAATALASALGGLVSVGEADTWYQSLNRAPGNPPGFVFGVVWPVLYILMAFSACRVWTVAGGWKHADAAMGIYFTQLLANLAWSVLFFRYHMVATGLADIAILWVLTLLMILQFRKHSPLAARLQYPYLAWLSFAGYLNAWVVFTN